MSVCKLKLEKPVHLPKLSQIDMVDSFKISDYCCILDLRFSHLIISPFVY